MGAAIPGSGRRWRYEPDESPKRKHRWDRPHLGFVEVMGSPIGKCPCTLSLQDAERLINEGVEWRTPRSVERVHPDRIYVVHEGAVYRAQPTNPGVSYHAFPEKPEAVARLPTSVRELLLARARALGCEPELRRYMRSTWRQWQTE